MRSRSQPKDETLPLEVLTNTILLWAGAGRRNKCKNSSMELAVIGGNFGCSDLACSDLDCFCLSKFLLYSLNIYNLGTHLAHTQTEQI